MQFSLTDDQRAIRDAASDFLFQAAGPEGREHALERTGGWDEILWKALAGEMGFAGLMVPETFGGSGLGAVEMSLVLEETGRTLAAAPLFETAVVAVQTILAAGGDGPAALLPAIASGETIATPVWPRDGHAWPRLTTAEGKARLTGTVDYCPFAHVADLLIVACLEMDGPTLIALPAGTPGVTTQARNCLDPLRPLATVRFDDVAIDPSWTLGDRGRGGGALARAQTVAAGLLAAELTGVSAYSLSSTVDYVQQRVQFGRPIGSFQAVKHDLADMMMQVEAARSAYLYAAAALDLGGAEAVEAASVAKAWCGDTARHCTSEAIQLHGGIGFTWEHPAHLYFKRARSASAWFGDPAHHREIVADLIGLSSSSLEPA